MKNSKNEMSRRDFFRDEGGDARDVKARDEVREACDDNETREACETDGGWMTDDAEAFFRRFRPAEDDSLTRRILDAMDRREIVRQARRPSKETSFRRGPLSAAVRSAALIFFGVAVGSLTTLFLTADHGGERSPRSRTADIESVAETPPAAISASAEEKMVAEKNDAKENPPEEKVAETSGQRKSPAERFDPADELMTEVRRQTAMMRSLAPDRVRLSSVIRSDSGRSRQGRLPQLREKDFLLLNECLN